MHEATRAIALLGLLTSAARASEVEAIYGIPAVDDEPPKAVALRCDTLQAAEPRAMMGRLTPAEHETLEACIDGSEHAVRASRIVLADALAKGDKTRWHLLAVRHATALETDDPDLLYRLAMHCYRADLHADVLTWAERAMAHKERWTGATRDSRVHGLLKLQARSQLALWQASGSETARAAAQAATLDWLREARRQERDATGALQLCASLAIDCETTDLQRKPNELTP